MNFPYRITPNTIVIAIGGTTHTVKKGVNPHYDEIVDAIKKKDWETVQSLIDVKTRVIEWSEGELEISGGSIFHKGEEIRTTIATRILQQRVDGFDIQPMVKLFNNIAENPSADARNEIFDWLEANDIPTTEDGYILGYKKVRDDYMDVYSGTILNKPGCIVSIDRASVDPDRRNECSTGLHFAAQSYMNAYSGARVVVVKVHPRDVVAVPADYSFAKARACRYEVIGEVVSSEPINEDHRLVEKSIMTNTEVIKMKEDAGVGSQPESLFKRGVRLGVISSTGMVSVVAGTVQESCTSSGDQRKYDNKKYRPIIKSICDSLEGAVKATIEATKPTPNNTPYKFQYFSGAAITRLHFLVAEIFGQINYVPTTSVNVDGLDMDEVLMAVEDEFNIVLDAGDIPDSVVKQRTLSQIVETIDSLVASNIKPTVTKEPPVHTSVAKVSGSLLDRMKAVGIEFEGTNSKNARVWVNAHGTPVKRAKLGVDTRSVKNEKTRTKLVAFVEALEEQKAAKVK